MANLTPGYPSGAVPAIAPGRPLCKTAMIEGPLTKRHSTALTEGRMVALFCFPGTESPCRPMLLTAVEYRPLSLLPLSKLLTRTSDRAWIEACYNRQRAHSWSADKWPIHGEEALFLLSDQAA